MSWKSGTELLERIADTYEALHGDVDHGVKVEFYTSLVEAFEENGWDSLSDVEGLHDALDEVVIEDKEDEDSD